MKKSIPNCQAFASRISSKSLALRELLVGLYDAPSKPNQFSVGWISKPSIELLRVVDRFPTARRNLLLTVRILRSLISSEIPLESANNCEQSAKLHDISHKQDDVSVNQKAINSIHLPMSNEKKSTGNNGLKSLIRSEIPLEKS